MIIKKGDRVKARTVIRWANGEVALQVGDTARVTATGKSKIVPITQCIDVVTDNGHTLRSIICNTGTAEATLERV